MNKEYYDIAKIKCLICRHVWILASYNTITKEQLYKWWLKVDKDHSKIHGKGGQNG